MLLLLSIMVIIIITFAFVFSFSKADNSRIHPENGVLDLENWEPDRDGVLSLSGEWDFFWKRFVSYPEAAGGSLKPDAVVDTPGVWNNYKIDGRKLPGFGYGTYRLKVVNVPEGIPLALRIPTFSTAYELYINDRLVSSNGMVGADEKHFEPGYLPQVVEFTPEDSGFTLIFYVSNFTYARGGMWYAVNMGAPEQIRGMDKAIADKDLFLFGALTVMAFYYLIIFLLRREDRSSLFYVFMCILFAGRTAIYGDYLIYRLVPFISFRAIINISYITMCWFSVCSAFMVRELFPEESIQGGLYLCFRHDAVIFDHTYFLFYPICEHRTGICHTLWRLLRIYLEYRIYQG